MERGLAFWNGLTLKRQVILVAATIGVFAAVLGLARLAATPSMALLYSGLEPAAAGDVVNALEAEGATYEVRGSAIYVDRSLRDSLRMTLAGEGLPANGASGYELLDSLSGFGTTSQMFDAAYWRAKEGELARTIVAARYISSARVHIANPGSRPFSRAAPVTASVTVTSADGTLSASQAKALRYLVASAVAGLDPEAVSIIDSSGGLIASGDDVAAAGATDRGDRAEALKRNAERILEARVGTGNAIVEVTVETVTESEMISERRFDPEGRIAISTDTEERSDTASDSRSGAVTVASNLPDGDAAAGDGSSSSSATETRERVNYEVSETQREVVREPGDIRRLSVAVLVDGVIAPGADGDEVWQVRPDAELKDLEDLVSAAVGLNASRGDTITVRSMQFEPVPEEGTEATAGFLGAGALDVTSLIQVAVLSIVALVLAFGVVRPILLSANKAGAAALPPPPAPPPADGLPDLQMATALDGEIDFGDASDEPGFPGFEGAGLPALPNSSADPVARLRKLIDDRQDQTVEILRGWMEDERSAR